VFTLWIPQVPFVVHVGQKIDLRTDIAFEILESFYLMIFLILPLLLFVIHRSINKGLKPLNSISREITQRTSDNLEPVDLRNVPAEIKGVTASLNNLFSRLKESFSRERQFIADAAHELRTPLAGLKAQAQTGLDDKSRVDKSLRRIVEGVDRTSRLTDQLLSLSRLDAENSVIENENIHLGKIIEDVCLDLQINKQENIKLVKKLDPAVSVYSDPNMVYILVRNLLDNSIRYSGRHAVIQISLLEQANGPIVEIIDNGPGIPEHNIKRVFDRFYRELNTNAPGSGLGLAIVKRITELLDIQITVSNRSGSGGLAVILKFKSF
jgi:two-component system sensor histidine kinase QseC